MTALVCIVCLFSLFSHYSWISILHSRGNSALFCCFSPLSVLSQSHRDRMYPFHVLFSWSLLALPLSLGKRALSCSMNLSIFLPVRYWNKQYFKFSLYILLPLTRICHFSKHRGSFQWRTCKNHVWLLDVSIAATSARFSLVWKFWLQNSCTSVGMSHYYLSFLL